MSQPASPIDLSRLEDYRATTLDPDVWSSNLAALAVEQIEFVAELRRVSLPETWRPARALDGFPTYRLEEPGQPPAWLADTAVPLKRAEATLAKSISDDKNVALPCLGTGAELVHLLERLPTHVAVFVFESDVKVLAAILQTQDCSIAISQGRCILLPPEREAAFLTAQMEAHPGLLPPHNILLADLVSTERLQELKGICEQVGRETIKRRNARLRELITCRPAELDTQHSERRPPRLAVLSLRPHPPTHVHAESLAHAARGLGWDVLCHTVADPRSVDGLVHCQALTEFAGNLTICVSHPTICQWNWSIYTFS